MRVVAFVRSTKVKGGARNKWPCCQLAWWTAVEEEEEEEEKEAEEEEEKEE